MNRERVVVSGLAYVTGLGFGHEDHEPALRQGRSAAAAITRFDTAGFRTRVGAQCDERGLAERLRARWPESRWRRFGVDLRMLLWTVDAALQDAGIPPETLRDPLPAFIGTTLEGLCGGEEWYDRLMRAAAPRPSRLLYCSAGAQIAAIAETLRLPLEPYLVSTACASGVTAIGRLFRSIRDGRREIGIAGGYDYLSRFTHLGFDSLGSLTSEPCAPFDRRRSGFFVGDAAAILVLESLSSALRRRARLRGELLAYGETADGYHPTHPDPQGRGVARAIRQCLLSTDVDPGGIDYINAHGTATLANDVAEAKGILAALGEACGKKINVSSTKPLTGHTLGAAGAVEQCFCFLALERGFLPLQANLSEPDPDCPLNFVREPKVAPRVAMNNSFGFGGANGVLLSRRWEET